MTDRQAGEYEREARELLLELFGPGVDAPPSRIRRFAEMLAQRDQERARPTLDGLKRKAFPPETKEERVKKSLDALAQPSPIDPNSIVGEDDEYDDENSLLSELLQAAKDAAQTLERVSVYAEANDFDYELEAEVSERYDALRSVVERARKLSNEVATSEGKG